MDEGHGLRTGVWGASTIFALALGPGLPQGQEEVVIADHRGEEWRIETQRELRLGGPEGSFVVRPPGVWWDGRGRYFVWDPSGPPYVYDPTGTFPRGARLASIRASGW